MANTWLREFLIKSATNLIDQILAENHQNSITPWEQNEIDHAYKNNIFTAVNGKFKFQDGREWSPWTINREYFCHLAIYSELVNQGYSKDQIKLEYLNLDLVIFENDKPVIGIEVKKSKKEAEKLIEGINAICESPDLVIIDRGNDPLRKAKYLLKIRPKEFWVVSPLSRAIYQVDYGGNGFRLTKQP